jgi:hypothetical protein
MKPITSLLAVAALITGIAVANAQGSTRQMDEQAGGNSGAVERNPNGTIGGSKANPSPTQVASRKYSSPARRAHEAPRSRLALLCVASVFDNQATSTKDESAR